MALLQSAGELVIRLSLPTDKEAGLVLDLFWQVTISGFAKSPGFLLEILSSLLNFQKLECWNFNSGIHNEIDGFFGLFSNCFFSKSEV